MKRYRNLLFVLVGLAGLAIMVSALVLGKAIARQAQDCIKICDEVHLSTIVKNLYRWRREDLERFRVANRNAGEWVNPCRQLIA